MTMIIFQLTWKMIDGGSRDILNDNTDSVIQF